MRQSDVVDLEVYNRDGANRPIDEPDPLWTAYERTRNFISEARPQTLDGRLAKARAAKAEARLPDGSRPSGVLRAG